MIPTSLFLVVSSTVWMMGRPSPSFRDAAEIATFDWLAELAHPEDVVLTSYESGAYLPARVNARVLVGHDLEAKDAHKKRVLVDRFFDAATEGVWRQQFLTQYSVDYVFWGPTERNLGDFDPQGASYLQQAYEHDQHAVFIVRKRE
jgi:hypothetical protein